ncbi:hypothetical protein KKQ10_10580 [Pseudomonas sp. MG-9]|uniref:Uncharacterized protein n=1 Tax=Pseudomonas serboccidentalis TaxID=2964670 RepID=A0ABY7ZF05_9PSED|nr:MULTISPECIES: hypothetical protein [Pseudomonas]MBT9265327.1 hypothetical protein [Pseudomonas sp. MG-9]WDR38227.1 hypothetical protein NN484_10960 [Pseudomonas serboccidentalis]
MTTQVIFLPKEKPLVLVRDDTFQWRLGGKQKTAKFRSFYQGEFLGEPYWAIDGGTGNFDDESYFAFSLTLPYQSDEALTGTYNLSHGLTFGHSHWIPAPPGFIGMARVTADSATLSIKYDTKTDIATGSFEAVFKSHRYRLNPKGIFTMTRLRPPEAN